MDWTFDQGENVACFSVLAIVESGAPILLVAHDEEDHDWQFLTGDAIKMEDAVIVSMRRIVDLDPTVLEIGHIPPGYQAIRNAVGAEWTVEKTGGEEDLN